MTTKPYFSHIEDIVSPELADLYTKVETCFASINYSKHEDDLNIILLSTDTVNSNQTLQVNDAYRSHIDEVLGLQGLFLENPYDGRLSDIVVILQAVCTVAVHKPSEIYSPEELEASESPIETFSNFVEIVTNFPSVNVIPLLHDIDGRVIDYILHDRPTLSITDDTVNFSKNRFKECEIEKVGVVVEGIRLFGRFGYTVASFVKEFGESLEDLSTSELAKNIVLLVLGSNTPENKLLDKMLDLADTLTDTPLDAVSTQTHIHRLVPTYVKK